jgi:hypothetical protein
MLADKGRAYLSQELHSRVGSCLYPQNGLGRKGLRGPNTAAYEEQFSIKMKTVKSFMTLGPKNYSLKL